MTQKLYIILSHLPIPQDAIDIVMEILVQPCRVCCKRTIPFLQNKLGYYCSKECYDFI